MDRFSLIGGFVAGLTVGVGVTYYAAVEGPRRGQLAQLAECIAGAKVLAPPGASTLSGTRLHEFLIVNRSVLKDKTDDLFFLDNTYRSTRNSAAPFGTYLVSGARVCVFERDHGGRETLSFRVVNSANEQATYLTYSQTGERRSSVALNTSDRGGDL